MSLIQYPYFTTTMFYIYCAVSRNLLQTPCYSTTVKVVENLWEGQEGHTPHTHRANKVQSDLVKLSGDDFFLLRLLKVDG